MIKDYTDTKPSGRISADGTTRKMMLQESARASAAEARKIEHELRDHLVRIEITNGYILTTNPSRWSGYASVNQN